MIKETFTWFKCHLLTIKKTDDWPMKSWIPKINLKYVRAYYKLFLLEISKRSYDHRKLCTITIKKYKCKNNLFVIFSWNTRFSQPKSFYGVCAFYCSFRDANIDLNRLLYWFCLQSSLCFKLLQNYWERPFQARLEIQNKDGDISVCHPQMDTVPLYWFNYRACWLLQQHSCWESCWS